MNFRRVGPLLLASLGLAGLSGCDYMLPEGFTLAQHRVLVQQGHLVDEKSIRQLQVGMSEEQVKFLMGTPLVQDAFQHDRWDYPYYKEAASVEETSELGLISIRFKEGQVTEVLRLVQIDAETESLDPSAVPDLDSNTLQPHQDDSLDLEQAEPESTP